MRRTAVRTGLRSGEPGSPEAVSVVTCVVVPDNLRGLRLAMLAFEDRRFGFESCGWTAGDGGDTTSFASVLARRRDVLLRFRDIQLPKLRKVDFVLAASLTVSPAASLSSDSVSG